MASGDGKHRGNFSFPLKARLMKVRDARLPERCGQNIHCFSSYSRTCCSLTRSMTPKATNTGVHPSKHPVRRKHAGIICHSSQPVVKESGYNPNKSYYTHSAKLLKVQFSLEDTGKLRRPKEKTSQQSPLHCAVHILTL